MSIDAEPYAITILEILADLSRKENRIDGLNLLVKLREWTGDNTLQSYDVKDAVAILSYNGYVETSAFMNELTEEYGFYHVWIDPLGRNFLKTIRDTEGIPVPIGSTIESKGKKRARAMHGLRTHIPDNP